MTTSRKTTVTTAFDFDSVSHPHRRTDPLSGRHVLISPHRALRPWLGQHDDPDNAEMPSYDPECYLCPRNDRVGGMANPDYPGTYVFDNDFPAYLFLSGPQRDATPAIPRGNARCGGGILRANCRTWPR